MTIKTFTTVALLFTACTAMAQHSKYVDELIASENAFAKMAADSGAKKAFVHNFDPQSVTFDGDKPINAYDYWSKAPDKGPLILWYPAVSAVSAAGDMGYNIGPSAIKRDAAATKIGYSGYFFSIWKRDAGGKFNVMLDGGAGKPMDQPFHEAKLINSKPLTGMPVSKPSTKSDILQVDNSFNASLINDVNSAYQSALADSSWLIRTGSYATTNKAANLQHLKIAKINSYKLTCMGGGMAKSNDLAYTYGRAELNIITDSGAKDVTGFYYRAWQRFANEWRIVADMVSY